MKDLAPPNQCQGAGQGFHRAMSVWGIEMYTGKMLISEQCQCSLGNGPGWGQGGMISFTSIAGFNVLHKDP